MSGTEASGWLTLLSLCLSHASAPKIVQNCPKLSRTVEAVLGFLGSCRPMCVLVLHVDSLYFGPVFFTSLKTRQINSAQIYEVRNPRPRRQL